MTTSTTASEGNPTLLAINDALASRDRAFTIERVKRAVIQEFERADRSVIIHATQYFRHTYIPDLVLQWRDDVDRPQRYVFLRSNHDLGELAEDVEIVARELPIVFGLYKTPNNKDAAILQGQSLASGTLVTDPTGLDELVGNDEGPSSVVSLMSRSILRGGRGLFDSGVATATRSAIVKGFAGAFETDAGPTAVAASVCRTVLGDGTSDRMVRLLHAVWLASGGRSDLFPDGPQAAGTLSDDALAFILNYRDVDDTEYWKRIGADVTLAQLGRLRKLEMSPNLGRLVLASADRIVGRFCRVRRDSPRLAPDAGLNWAIDRGLLALSGSDFTAYFAIMADDVAEIPVTQADAISLEELRVRCRRAEANIRDITGTSSTRRLSYGAEDRSDIVEDKELERLLQSVGGAIASASGVLDNGHVLDCDFRSSTASSRTRAVLTMRELVRHGLPLVWQLLESDYAELASFVDPVSVETQSDQLPLRDNREESLEESARHDE